MTVSWARNQVWGDTDAVAKHVVQLALSSSYVSCGKRGSTVVCVQCYGQNQTQHLGVIPLLSATFSSATFSSFIPFCSVLSFTNTLFLKHFSDYIGCLWYILYIDWCQKFWGVSAPSVMISININIVWYNLYKRPLTKCNFAHLQVLLHIEYYSTVTFVG